MLHTLQGIYWRFWDLSQINVLMSDVRHTLWVYFTWHFCITDVSIYNKKAVKLMYYVRCTLYLIQPTLIFLILLGYIHYEEYIGGFETWQICMTDGWNILWVSFMCIVCIADVSIYNQKTCKTDVSMFDVYYYNFYIYIPMFYLPHLVRHWSVHWIICLQFQTVLPDWCFYSQWSSI